MELFLPRFRDGDPYLIAQEIRQKAEAVMRNAGVLQALLPGIRLGAYEVTS